MRRRHGFTMTGLALLAMAFGVPAARAATATAATHAGTTPNGNTITITTLSDTEAQTGSCSLPEAIANANANAQTYAPCPAGSPGADTIQFGLSGTITLAGALPEITDSLVVDGSGQTVTINGNSNQIFTARAGAAFSLSDLTLTNGTASGLDTSLYAAGGAVFTTGGSLTITDCAFATDSAPGLASGTPGGPSPGAGGAVYSGGGAVSITGSTFTGDSTGLNDYGAGGAVFSGGPLTITSSNFTDDTSYGDGGGAIAAEDGITVAASSFGSDAADAAPGFSDDPGGAVDVSAGTVSITGSTFTGNTSVASGGALYTSGLSHVTISKSTFSGNSANDGGAVAATLMRGPFVVTSSTFARNKALSGGGLWADGSAGTAAITDDTFAGNSAPGSGGGVVNSTLMTITASTFSGNSSSSGSGGNLFATAPGTPGGSPSVTLRSTILAGAGTAGNCVSGGPGAIIDGDYNISDDGSCALTAPHSLSHTAPGLASAGLASNGGPTQTIALAPGSRAIDAVPPAACQDAAGTALPTDQRGYARPADGNADGVANCDAGAYESGSVPRGEVQPGPVFTVTTTADSHEPVCFLAQDGSCSLHDAIMMANAYAREHPRTTATVQLATGASYVLTTADNTGSAGANALPVVLGRVTVQGAGATVQRSSAAPMMRLLQTAAGAVLTVVDTRLAGGDSPGSGGGLLNAGTLTLTQSVVRGSTSGGAGGGLYNTGTAAVNSSTFSADTATGKGGAMLNHGQLTVDDSTVTGNSAASGGAVASNAGRVTLINATLSADSAGHGAGEVTIGAGSVSFANTIVGHTAGAGNCAFAQAAAHTDAGHNLDSGLSCEFSSSNASLSDVSPGLGALASYGGPTPTMQLKAGSPAINAGSNSVCQAAPVSNLDQRGITRITGTDPTCDIGAFEYQTAPGGQPGPAA